MIEDGRVSTFSGLDAKPTQGWTGRHAVFNSLANEGPRCNRYDDLERLTELAGVHP